MDIADLVGDAPGGLGHYRPRLRYLLLDAGRYADSELAPLRNLAVALFRMESSRTPKDVEQVLAANGSGGLNNSFCPARRLDYTRRGVDLACFGWEIAEGIEKSAKIHARYVKIAGFKPTLDANNNAGCDA